MKSTPQARQRFIELPLFAFLALAFVVSISLLPYPGDFLLKVAPIVCLAVAVAMAGPGNGRRLVVAALVFSGIGDVSLECGQFTLGLGAFLVAHLCYLGALLPLRGRSGPRLAGATVVVAAVVGMLVWFWPRLLDQGLVIPVTVYMAVLGAMVCAALLARLPTPWTALGAVCFAVSDGMIGTGQFVLQSHALEVPIWWVYAASQVLITAGFFFGRVGSGAGGGPAAR